MEKSPTTKTQFNLFRRDVKKWLKNFGLTDWEIYVSHEALPPDVIGLCSWDAPNRVCYIQFCTEWDNENVSLTDLEIRCVAFHEVFHMLTCELYDMAMSRSIEEEKLDAQFHSLIKNLQNLFIRKKIILP
jgi:hypothetical protein